MISVEIGLTDFIGELTKHYFYCFIEPNKLYNRDELLILWNNCVQEVVIRHSKQVTSN